MLSQVPAALMTAMRGVIWFIYGPYSGLIPVLLLYGMIEFGLDFFTSRSRRERRLDGAMVITCTIGVVVWLAKTHIPLALLALLGLSLIATIVFFIQSIRGKRRRAKKRRLHAESRTGLEGTVETGLLEAAHETEEARSESAR